MCMHKGYNVRGQQRSVRNFLKHFPSNISSTLPHTRLKPSTLPQKVMQNFRTLALAHDVRLQRTVFSYNAARAAAYLLQNRTTKNAARPNVC